MKRVYRFLLWGLVFLVLLAVCDQLLLRLPATGGGPLPVIRSFYRDFRTRLFSLAGPGGPGSIEGVIEQAAAPPARRPDKGPRYLYVDGEGTLHFADSLNDIPPSFRASAQKLEK